MASEYGIRAVATLDNGAAVERLYFVGSEARIVKDIKRCAFELCKSAGGTRIVTIHLAYGVHAREVDAADHVRKFGGK